MRVRNNRLLRRIERSGCHSVREFCDRHKLSYSNVCDLVALRSPAFDYDTGWRRLPRRLAAIFAVPPEELFRGRQLTADLAATTVEREIDEDAMLSLSGSTMLALPSSQIDPETAAVNGDLMPRLLEVLSERERLVVEQMTDGKTHEEIAEEIGVGKARVAQIYQKALSRMRHRAVLLREMSLDHPTLEAERKRDAKQRAAAAERDARQRAKGEKAYREWQLQQRWRDGWICTNQSCRYHHIRSPIGQGPRLVCQACGQPHKNPTLSREDVHG